MPWESFRKTTYPIIALAYVLSADDPMPPATIAEATSLTVAERRSGSEASTLVPSAVT